MSYDQVSRSSIVKLFSSLLRMKLYLVLVAVLSLVACGKIFIRSPADGQTNIYTPFTLQMQKNNDGCSFNESSFHVYLDKNTNNSMEISSAFTRPGNSNIWTAQDYALPLGSHRLSVEGSFSGTFCQSDSDSQQIYVRNNPYTAEFTGLGMLPGMVESTASAISNDGTTIVGSSAPNIGSLGRVAFRWRQDSGMLSMGMPGGADSTRASDVSADGSVIVGRITFNIGGDYRDVAFRWTSAGYQELGDLPGGFVRSSAGAISADGLIIAGDSSSGGVELFRWTQSTGMVGLGDLPGGVVGAFASGIADNGVIVGAGTPDYGQIEAVRWTQSGGLVGLGDFQDSSLQSAARDISSDGNVIVGHGSPNGTLGEYEAARWEGGTMYHLGYLPGDNSSIAYAVSGDGSTIVGWSRGSGDGRAFRWTISDGMQSIAELLNSNGVSTSGWVLTTATGVSADGKIIVGYGRNPSGQTEAWRAVLP